MIPQVKSKIDWQCIEDKTLDMQKCALAIPFHAGDVLTLLTDPTPTRKHRREPQAHEAKRKGKKKRRKEGERRKNSLTDTPDRVVSEHGSSSDPMLIHTSPQMSIINNIPVLRLGIKAKTYIARHVRRTGQLKSSGVVPRSVRRIRTFCR